MVRASGLGAGTGGSLADVGIEGVRDAGGDCRWIGDLGSEVEGDKGGGIALEFDLDLPGATPDPEPVPDVDELAVAGEGRPSVSFGKLCEGSLGAVGPLGRCLSLELALAFEAALLQLEVPKFLPWEV